MRCGVVRCGAVGWLQIAFSLPPSASFLSSRLLFFIHPNIVSCLSPLPHPIPSLSLCSSPPPSILPSPPLLYTLLSAPFSSLPVFFPLLSPLNFRSSLHLSFALFLSLFLTIALTLPNLSHPYSLLFIFPSSFPHSSSLTRSFSQHFPTVTNEGIKGDLENRWP